MERWFINTTGSLTGREYWMGVEHAAGSRYRWFLLDGTYIGNGEPNNGDPYYAHWWVALRAPRRASGQMGALMATTQ